MVNAIKIAIFLIFVSCKLLSLEDRHSAVVFGAENAISLNSSDQFYSCWKKSSYPDSFNSWYACQITECDILHALIQNPVFCAKRYNLSTYQVSKLLGSDPEQLVSELMKFNHLIDAGIWELWCLCKTLPRQDRQLRKKYKKQDAVVEKQLVQALQIRHNQQQIFLQKQKQEAQAKLQELQHVEKVYDVAISSNNSYVSRHEKEREIAFQKTKHEKFAQREQRYELDEQTAGLLLAHDIDYKHYQKLSGTVLQHQLFKESLDCFKKAAKHYCAIGLKTGALGSSSLEFAVAGCTAAELENLQIAMVCNDVADFLVETAASMCCGIIGSACTVVDMITHPIKTAQQFGTMLAQILPTIGAALNVYDPSIVPVYHRQSCQQQFNKDLQKFNDMCAIVRVEFGNKNFQEKVQMSTEFICDGWLHPKLLAQVGKACLGVCRLFPELPAIQDLVSSAPQVMTTFGEFGLEDLERSFINLMESEGDQIFKAKLPYTIWPVKKIADQVRRYKNKIPLCEQELLANLKYFVEKRLARASQKISTTVNRKYRQMRKKVEGSLVDIQSDLDHVANFGYRLDKDIRQGIAVFKLDGGHLAGSVRALERAGLINVKEERMLKYGCKGYVIEDIITGQIMYKTEFPASWDLEKIMSKIFDEAFDNVIQIEMPNKGRLIMFGRTQEGLEIKIVLDQIDDGYKLVTVYPVFD